MISSSAQLPDSLRDAAGWSPRDDAAFRWLVRRYEEVTRDRVKVGQRLAAIFEGRDPDWGDRCRSDAPIERLLSDIRHGRRDQPAPVAGTYHELCETERGLREQIAVGLRRHPAGAWLERIHGVGTMLGAQLVARLDRARARRPSSFWAFCGLATMPAMSVRCTDCGAKVELAVGVGIPTDHADARDTARRCHGELVPMESGGAEVRVATSRGGPAVQRNFDQAARATCHQIGVTMVRTNGTYAPVYHEASKRFQREREGWSGGRIHLSALRVMEKRFLLDLWHAWPPPHASGDGRLQRAVSAPAPDRPAAAIA